MQAEPPFMGTDVDLLALRTKSIRFLHLRSMFIEVRIS